MRTVNFVSASSLISSQPSFVQAWVGNICNLSEERLQTLATQAWNEGFSEVLAVVEQLMLMLEDSIVTYSFAFAMEEVDRIVESHRLESLKRQKTHQVSYLMREANLIHQLIMLRN